MSMALLGLYWETDLPLLCVLSLCLALDTISPPPGNFSEVITISLLSSVLLTVYLISYTLFLLKSRSAATA